MLQLNDKMMQLDDRLTGERLPNKTKVVQTAVLLASDEGIEQLEGRLLEQLQAGNTHLLFPIGQFYFEQVIFIERCESGFFLTTCQPCCMLLAKPIVLLYEIVNMELSSFLARTGLCLSINVAQWQEDWISAMLVKLRRVRICCPVHQACLLFFYYAGGMQYWDFCQILGFDNNVLGILESEKR